jgi:hypothetical protein
MRIGIIGTGIMARGLGGHWARAGHELLIGGRSAAKAQDLARTLGARSGTPEEAALFGEATLLAVPYDAVAGVLASAGAGEGAPRGRVLIDCTTAVGPGFLLTTGPGPGAARRIAAATGGRVVKAFSHVTNPSGSSPRPRPLTALTAATPASPPSSPKTPSPSPCAATTKRRSTSYAGSCATPAAYRSTGAAWSGPSNWRPPPPEAGGRPPRPRGKRGDPPGRPVVYWPP